uniref:Uncharacterized protein n=1 Tax=Salarias fasciatus TaxID=181472 RepID=A0A672HPT3_SALFA
RLSRLLHAAVDGEGRSLMAALKSRLHAMPRLHIVQLGGAGADPRKPEHGRYLTAFCQEVMSHLKVELDGCRSDGSSLEEDEEARFHDELCTRLAEGVQGRDGLLEELRLTALLCRLARTLAQGTTIVVIRLLAARHPLAPDINDVILSVCRQLCAALQLAPPLQPGIARGATVLVVLDSLDSLSDHCHASKLRWLPARLPPNVHLLASADDGGMALANARLKLDDSCFFRVGGVSLEDGERLVEAWLGVARRKLTAEQREAVGRSLEAASGGLLYGRLAVAVALRWASFTAKAELRLGADLQDMLMLMMLALERRHGPRLVGGALGYISHVFREGLLEAELRDLLSLDDDVISEVYRLSPPPSPS